MKTNYKVILYILLFQFSVSVLNAQWVQTSGGMNGGDVKCIASSGSFLYAGTNLHGVYISSDNGNTWTQSSLKQKSVYSLAISNNRILAGTNLYGLYTSDDNGITWVQSSLNNQIVSVLLVSGSNIFAGAINGSIFLWCFFLNR